jgi:two-component system, NtrC family, sensor kinase
MTGTGLPSAPLTGVDIVGSTLMIALSLLCLAHAHALRRGEPQSVIWTYLQWFVLGLLLFSVSRSGSHLIKYLLVHTGREADWIALRPWTGSLNTVSFVIVGAITLFFHRVHSVYRQTVEDKQEIETAHAQIVQLNENLERLVLERTRALSASEEKYRRMFEGSKDMLVILDDQGTLLDVNHAGVDMLGYEGIEDLLGRNLIRDFLVDPSERKRLETLDPRDDIKDREVGLRKKNGEELTALLSVTVRKSKDGRPEGFEATLKDITHRRMMEAQLMQAEKLASLGQLSAGVAHEINNPLGLILGYTQLLCKETAQDTQAYEDLKVIEKHTMSCKKIVEDLLKFSRSVETTKRVSDVNEVLEGVLRVVESNFAKDGVDIVRDLASDLPEAVVDAEKLEQVFMNLLMNARQAMEGKGTIQVSTESIPEEGVLVIRVADNGCGIPEEIQPKIFDPFFTTKPTGMGTGLGLSVSYGIIQEHGGEIEMKSRPGEGTTFTVRLPLGAGQEAS